MSFFEAGDAVLIPNPGYPTYAAAVKLSGATTISYDLLPTNQYQPDFEALEWLLKNQNAKEKSKACSSTTRICQRVNSHLRILFQDSLNLLSGIRFY
jgi:bifunctional pyridoxal-dependent enzyme with beta-cystathionase and maltose regulon repressor activities